MTSHITKFVVELYAVLRRSDVQDSIERMVVELVAMRERGGRLFVLGVGGGAANAAHAVNDFRKLCGIEAYAPTDGIAELTARANDEGWQTIFAGWLRASRLNRDDVILVFSVGGGADGVSQCITNAVLFALTEGACVLGVVGKSYGAVAAHGRVTTITGIKGPLLTPVTETVQIAVLHALVSDPRLQTKETKW